MSESIQMRVTQEQSGDYRVFAAKGDEPIKGLALHNDILEAGSDLLEADYVEVTIEEGGAVSLDADKFTGSTFRVASDPAVRHAYLTPKFVQSFGYEGDIPTDETFDVEGFPSIGISNVEASDEETYDEEQNSSAEEAADALFGDESESEDSEADSESENEEEVGVADEELGIAE